MNSITQLKKFVFNGFLLDDSLTTLENNGISIKKSGHAENVNRISEKDFSPIIITNGVKMASIFTVFFCLENAVRNLIQERLSERIGPTWWVEAIPSKIKDDVQKLKQKEEINKYHAERSTTLLGYTTFGQLCQIIVYKWNEFSDLFPNQHWVTSRFNDLEMSRNIIMHTGVLPQIEIDRIESIARDWVRQIG